MHFEWFARKIERTAWVGMILWYIMNPCTYRCFGGILWHFQPLKSHPLKQPLVVSYQDHGYISKPFLCGPFFECLVLGSRDFNIRKPYPKNPKTSRSKQCQCPNHFSDEKSLRPSSGRFSKNPNHALAATGTLKNLQRKIATFQETHISHPEKQDITLQTLRLEGVDMILSEFATGYSTHCNLSDQKTWLLRLCRRYKGLPFTHTMKPCK